jgi:hypothetical protein
LKIQISLLNLSLTCYPDDIDFVNEIFKLCETLISKYEKIFISKNFIKKENEEEEEKEEEKIDEDELKNNLKLKQELEDIIEKLIITPIKSYNSIRIIFELEGIVEIYNKLSYKTRRQISLKILSFLYEFEDFITSFNETQILFSLIQPLVKGSFFSHL